MNAQTKTVGESPFARHGYNITTQSKQINKQTNKHIFINDYIDKEPIGDEEDGTRLYERCGGSLNGGGGEGV